MAQKVTMLFRDGSSGWSETFFFQDSEQYTVKRFCEILAAQRSRVLGVGAKIVAARHSLTSSPKKVKLIKLNVQGVASTGDGKTAEALQADSPYTCVLIPFQTAKGTRRVVTLSGFPDGLLARSSTDPLDEFGLNELGRTKVDKYRKELEEAPSLLIKERKDSDDFAQKDIQEVSTDPDGRYRITYEGGASLKAGDKVAFTKLKGNALGNLRGVRKVAEIISPTEFIVDRGPRADEGTPKVFAGAKMQKIGYDYKVALYTEEGFTYSSRKRGRPFSPRRGRRSASR